MGRSFIRFKTRRHWSNGGWMVYNRIGPQLSRLWGSCSEGHSPIATKILFDPSTADSFLIKAKYGKTLATRSGPAAHSRS